MLPEIKKKNIQETYEVFFEKIFNKFTVKSAKIVDKAYDDLK